MADSTRAPETTNSKSKPQSHLALELVAIEVRNSHSGQVYRIVVQDDGSTPGANTVTITGTANARTLPAGPGAMLMVVCDV